MVKKSEMKYHKLLIEQFKIRVIGINTGTVFCEFSTKQTWAINKIFKFVFRDERIICKTELRGINVIITCPISESGSIFRDIIGGNNMFFKV